MGSMSSMNPPPKKKKNNGRMPTSLIPEWIGLFLSKISIKNITQTLSPLWWYVSGSDNQFILTGII